jgi:hypothetical protein
LCQEVIHPRFEAEGPIRLVAVDVIEEKEEDDHRPSGGQHRQEKSNLPPTRQVGHMHVPK